LRANPDRRREDRARRIANLQGLRLRKLRWGDDPPLYLLVDRRTIGTETHGTYGEVVVGDRTLDAIEAYLEQHQETPSLPRGLTVELAPGYDVRIAGDLVHLLVTQGEYGPHPTVDADDRTWGTQYLPVDDARELALQLQEAAQLIAEEQALVAEERALTESEPDDIH
jgi:hypothetical protein